MAELTFRFNVPISLTIPNLNLPQWFVTCPNELTSVRQLENHIPRPCGNHVRQSPHEVNLARSTIMVYIRQLQLPVSYNHVLYIHTAIININPAVGGGGGGRWVGGRQRTHNTKIFLGGFQTAFRPSDRKQYWVPCYDIWL
jgi:hypothetical protein